MRLKKTRLVHLWLPEICCFCFVSKHEIDSVRQVGHKCQQMLSKGPQLRQNINNMVFRLPSRYHHHHHHHHWCIFIRIQYSEIKAKLQNKFIKNN